MTLDFLYPQPLFHFPKPYKLAETLTSVLRKNAKSINQSNHKLVALEFPVSRFPLGNRHNVRIILKMSTPCATRSPSLHHHALHIFHLMVYHGSRWTAAIMIFIKNRSVAGFLNHEICLFRKDSRSSIPRAYLITMSDPATTCLKL
jgi:hypothetical protein